MSFSSISPLPVNQHKRPSCLHLMARRDLLKVTAVACCNLRCRRRASPVPAVISNPGTSLWRQPHHSDIPRRGPKIYPLTFGPDVMMCSVPVMTVGGRFCKPLAPRLRAVKIFFHPRPPEGWSGCHSDGPQQHHLTSSERFRVADASQSQLQKAAQVINVLYFQKKTHFCLISFYVQFQYVSFERRLSRDTLYIENNV